MIYCKSSLDRSEAYEIHRTWYDTKENQPCNRRPQNRSFRVLRITFLMAPNWSGILYMGKEKGLTTRVVISLLPFVDKTTKNFN